MTYKTGFGLSRGPWCSGVIVALFAMVTVPFWAEAEELPTTPREYERYALEHHRGLWAQRDRYRANLREAEGAQSRWPQPMFGYDVEIGTPWSQSGVTHMGMVSQTIPWPGVLDQMAEPARRQADAEAQRFQGLARQIVYEVRSVLIEIARIEAIEAVVEEQRALYGEAISILEQTMATGRGDYSDVLRLSTASERLADRLDILRSQREQQVAALRALMDLEAGVVLRFDFGGEEDPLAVEEQSVDVAALVAQMSAEHPELALLRAQGALAEARGEVARSRRLPWPTVRLGYGNMPAMGGEGREDVVLLGFSLPLPLFTRQYDAEVDAARLQQSAFAEEERVARRRLSSQIEASATRVEESLMRLRRYRLELLPLASDVTERMAYEMETGQRSVTDYLLAVQQQLELETSVVELGASIARDLARLDLLAGQAIEALSIVEERGE